MKAKTIALIAGVLSAVSAEAQTIGPGCGFEWDYSEIERTMIDGFRFYLNGTPSQVAIPSAATGVSCEAVGLTQGAHTVYVTAFNAVQESGPSNSLSIVFVEAPPNAPQSFRLVVEFGAQ